MLLIVGHPIARWACLSNSSAGLSTGSAGGSILGLWSILFVLGSKQQWVAVAAGFGHAVDTHATSVMLHPTKSG